MPSALGKLKLADITLTLSTRETEISGWASVTNPRQTEISVGKTVAGPQEVYKSVSCYLQFYGLYTRKGNFMLLKIATATSLSEFIFT